MNQQTIIVNEAPPRLASLGGVQAREFIKNYAAYAARQVAGTAVPMRYCLLPEDYSDLLAESEHVIDQVMADMARAAAAPVGAQADQRAGVAAAINAEEGPEEGSESEDSVDASAVTERANQREGVGEVAPYERGSNDHIIAMLSVVVGPRTVDEAAMLFMDLQMEKGTPYVNNLPATKYARDWKTMVTWCALAVPTEKWLVRQFIKGIHPPMLQRTLNLLSLRQIDPCIDLFRAKYRAGVEAAIILGGPASNGGPGRWGRETEVTRPVAVVTPSRGHAHQGQRRPGEYVRPFHGFAPRGAPRAAYTPRRDTGVHPVAPVAQAAPAAAAQVTPRQGNAPVCFHCGQTGHIRPQCPMLTPAPVDRAVRPRLGSMLLGKRAKPKQVTEELDL